MTTSAEPQVTVQTALNLGITEDEFRSIVDIMGRTPNFNEISIFSVMWSEHCSYKNSILWLKTLPRDGGRLLRLIIRTGWSGSAFPAVSGRTGNY